MRLLIIRNKKFKSSYTACIYALLEAIGRGQEHNIVFNDSFKQASTSSENTMCFVTVTPASFINKFIQQFRLSSFIKKSKTHLLIQPAAFFIKQKRVPQLMIADNIERLPTIKKISYSKIFLLTYSQFAKQAITDKGFANIIHVVPLFAGAEYAPITWSMKQQVKIDYTEGREYFYIPTHFKSIEAVLNILKAFSGFKKWQQSSMKLVLGGKLYVPPSDWEEKINTYKYREDVLLCNNLPEEEKIKLLAGAYASIHLPENDADLLPLLQSVQCGTPVIAFETGSIQEYAADAVLTAPATNYEALTQQMILMYKDELLRNKLAENCALRAEVFSKEKAIEVLQSIVL